MFSTPGIRIFSQENADTVPRKPGATAAVPRKPFLDRAVNGATPTPNIRKTLKFEAPKAYSLCGIQKELASIHKHVEDDLFIYDTNSYWDVEELDEYYNRKYSKESSVFRILASSCYYKCETPPPEFDTFFETPKLMAEDDVDINDDYKPDLTILEERDHDVSLPTLDNSDSFEDVSLPSFD